MTIKEDENEPVETTAIESANEATIDASSFKAVLELGEGSEENVGFLTASKILARLIFIVVDLPESCILFNSECVCVLT